MIRPVTAGILAHVDAGKTTLSEQLLYKAGAIRSPGRVDHGDTALDTDQIERQRGITVFAGQACFTIDDRHFTLIDTPGHVDFAAEAERALLALDMAVLMIDGGAGLQGHTLALFRMAQSRDVPVILFVNKTDLPSYDPKQMDEQIQRQLTDAAVPIENGTPDMEKLALLDDAFCERYLAGDVDEAAAWQSLQALFQSRKAFPLLRGAALSGQGVAELLDALARLSVFSVPAKEEADALIYKIRREANGDRVAFAKVQSGVLRPRDAFHLGDTTEKIYQLRRYQGASFIPVDQARAGEAIGIVGLSLPRCGDRLLRDSIVRDATDFHTQPVLAVRALPPKGVAPAQLLEKLRILEDEDPMLGVDWDSEHGSITLKVMGAVQTEVLAQILQNRFGLAVSFLPPLVLYRETIAAPVVGCGHYEPLRHYAEAHLLLSPGPRDSGIQFDSRCHVDDLAVNFQSLIRTHVLEKAHKGVLTGSPLTDVRVSLLSGRAHLKHTEGGDFREATYRAIRQGLMKAQSLLLEPFYRFTLTLPSDSLGRAMTDITALCGSYDPPQTLGDTVLITGRGPVRSLMHYPTQVRAYTHGKGDIQLESDGYDLCHNPDEVIAEMAYDVGADVQNSPGSVFCSHGAGYLVNWDQADSLMHLPVEKAQ